MPKKLTKYIAVDPVGSKFAKALQRGLQEQGINCLRVSRQKGDDHAKQGKPVFFVTAQTLDKVQQFRAFAANGVACPPFTTSAAEVKSLPGKTIFARTNIRGTNGDGIVEFNRDDPDIPAAPLYTSYIPKKSEFRVHVLHGRVIDRQQKRKRSDAAEANFKIRNHHNGFIYARDGLVSPSDMDDLAIRAVAAVGYRYGAVDIIWNEKENRCYVLEVNSRPGLEGTTVQSYVNVLKDAT